MGALGWVLRGRHFRMLRGAALELPGGSLQSSALLNQSLGSFLDMVLSGAAARWFVPREERPRVCCGIKLVSESVHRTQDSVNVNHL